jgi:hypothetical protein
MERKTKGIREKNHVYLNKYTHIIPSKAIVQCRYQWGGVSHHEA